MNVEFNNAESVEATYAWDELGPGIWQSTDYDAGVIVISDDEEVMFFCEHGTLEEVEVKSWAKNRFVPFQGELILSND